MSPLNSLAVRTLCAATAAAVALSLYWWTLAPTVTLVDSGELIVAARGLGVAHPPGFPLYVLLAHSATWLLPFADVAKRANFASAVFAALAVGMMAAVMGEALLTVLKAGAPPKTIGRGDATAEGIRTLSVGIAPVLVAALLLAGSRTLWAYATVAEVYTLNTFLILTVFFLMLRWRRRILASGRARRTSATQHADGWLYAAALVFGLALGVHHVTVGLTLPGLAALVYATEGRAFFTSRRIMYAALCAFTGLSIYAYLPLAAARSLVLNWGDPETLQRIWWHVTGRQYQAYMSFSSALVGRHVTEFVRLITREFGPWWLPVGLVLAGIGLAAVFQNDRALCVMLLLIIAADLAYGLSYDIAEDKDAYYLPTVVALVIAAGIGAQQSLLWARARHREPGATLLSVALLLVPAVALASNFRFNDRSRYFIAHDYVDNILDTIAPGGMLLTLDWQVCSPLLYVRTIEERRRDVIVIDVNMLRRSWYFDYLRREYPDLIAGSHDKVEAFLEDLRHWEQDPQAYERDRSLNRRIDARFHDMLLDFVGRHIGSAPIYVTQDIVLSRDPSDAALARALSTTYQLVPQGLAFQLFADRAVHEPAEPVLRTRGLTDGTLRFEPDDVVELKVLPVYVTMLYNRGRYLALIGRQGRAAAAFKQAVALDPGFVPAQQALAESLRATRGE